MASIYRSSVSVLLAFVLLVQHTVVASGSAFTQQVCVTHRTSPSLRGPVPTKTLSQTIKIPQDVFFTTTPGTTVTPSQFTQTTDITVTAISESDIPQSTDVFTATSITTETNTITLTTQTVINTSTSTSTTTTSASGTTTVPTPAGFSPVLDTLPGSQAKRKRRSFDPRVQARATTPKSSPAGLCPIPGANSPSSWPAVVTCLRVVESFIPTTFTKTASKTTTVTAATPTTILSVTSTTTIAIIVTTPDASSTVTLTGTLTGTLTIAPLPTTSVTSSTVTVTAASYTATAYAQCAASSNNFVGTLDNAGIYNSYETDGLGALQGGVATNDSTPQACCNSCAANPLCATSVFEPYFYAGSQCYLILTSAMSCSPGEYSLEATYDSDFGPDQAYTISNGNCGIYNSAANQD